jgi:hypothetical protein
MRIVAMLANLLIHYLIVKMIVVNSAHECNEGSWQDEEAMAQCQTHMVLLDTTEKAEV